MDRKENMTNQDIVDLIDAELLGVVDFKIREKVLDAVWDVLQDNRADDEEND
jgi:hypothetical protein